MFFNSKEFIFLFLPIALFLYFLLQRLRYGRCAIFVLILSSLYFYSYSHFVHIWLFLGSIVFNYLFSKTLYDKPRRSFLCIGIVVNLIILFYFKYLDFVTDSINYVTNGDLPALDLILPLAISFFTFQQIAYLVDVYTKKIQETSLSNYLLFVSFFPQLIAGPIVHYNEVISQFESGKNRTLDYFTAGVICFCIGLFKKVILADSLAEYSNGFFNTSISLGDLGAMTAWSGVLCFHFQIYFDFSGYSDMALGLAKMFGVRLPKNFDSPYKTRSIKDFWSRWHITLSTFLKTYVYFPLGGNRISVIRTYLNLSFTMLIAGIWHGANWTFVLWGILHGAYLVLFNVAKRFLPNFPFVFSIILTNFAVIIAWVLFRAESLESAKNIYSALFFFNGLGLSDSHYAYLANIGLYFESLRSGSLAGFYGIPQLSLLMVCSVFVYFLPNSNRIVDWYLSLKSAWGNNSNRLMFIQGFIGFITGWVMFVSISFLWKINEFVYFKF
jgi:D-alanyl-lipoteichoic acid acyltransferase DltB (MBOAT superfamily)